MTFTPVSQDQMGAVFAAIGRAAAIITIRVRAEDPGLNKTGNPFWIAPVRASKKEGREAKPGQWLVGKESTLRVIVNASYATAVRKRLAQRDLDPDLYVPGSSWHVWYKDANGDRTPFAVHKEHGLDGGLYIPCMVIGCDEVRYFDPMTNDTVSAEYVRPFKPEHKLSARQLIVTVDDKPYEVVWRTPALDHIMEVRYCGQCFISDLVEVGGEADAAVDAAGAVA